MGHFRLSPSGSSRWLACPYSAQADLPQFTNEAAESGTEQHQWAADVLLGNCLPGDVPKEYQAGIFAYVNHVESNRCDRPLVEHQMESIAVDEHGGTIDCLLIQDRKCAVYDYKSGRWPVDAKGNTQLLCYAAIAAEHFDVSEFYGVIVQPFAFKGDKVKVAEFTLEQVDEHRDRVAVAAKSDEKCAGDHCRFCPLRKAGMCAEGASYAAKHTNWKS